MPRDGTSRLIEDVRREKYMQAHEDSWDATRRRVSTSLFSGDSEKADRLERELSLGRACPAGRVMAGAGTGKNVTLWNCFVAPLLQDSMRTDPSRSGKGIMDTLASVAYSMQMGGGVGTDFSPLRPKGALVRRVMAEASGPLSFMDMWDAMCRTIMSAGYRRGAMMATLACDHPDLLDFVRAKREPGRLRMFNLSILVSDAFMAVVEQDEMWDLGHVEPPFDRSKIVEVLQRDGQDWFVYRRVPARELWREIMETTYKYSEPGVIFIDRVNRMNNLWYCEDIRCTNPCGEQPLPPDANCNLSHIVLAQCMSGPLFTDRCFLNLELIRGTASILVRMSDNVIDLSPVPTEEQRVEAQMKRRIGLGVTALANALMFVRMRYGSLEAVEQTREIMRTVRDAAYLESIEIAKEKGPFSAFDRDNYLKGAFVRTLPEEIRDGIAEYGIRNALLLTIAPVGTQSIASGGNSSGGVEPVFLARYVRRKLAADGSFDEYSVEDLGFREYADTMHDGDMDEALRLLPDYMVTTRDLSPEDHLVMMAACQEFVDAAISKTVNVPTDISYEAFAGVYRRAYDLGCKSCTTYREVPDSGRGSVLTDVVGSPLVSALRERPDVLEGKTYRMRWSGLPYPMFMTINDEVLPSGEHVPFEIFINSKAVDYAHWVSALTRMISAVMRKGGDLTFIPDELKQVWSARGGEFIDQKFVPSEIALIGLTLERHFRDIGYITTSSDSVARAHEIELTGPAYAELGVGRECPSCSALQLVRAEGCDKCMACGYNRCG